MFRNFALAGLVATGVFLLLPAPPGGRLVKIYGELLLCHSYGSVVCAKAMPGLPVSDVAAFGARVFDAGSGGHSDYFAPGTASLRNLTMIALGRSGQVTA
ncbi:hypothetical protein E1267_27495 [Nonomuraea longispora]|uniref:DUF1023 domain-containing protein n=1 Tax=Nonomuraea longispora TaxID=1848320 RepID=A0A4R4N7D8_9ACTN|nr:alpha/beta hydrolase [Nonomuraea longispora]TDC03060.1 hypothetical protein E1267_27495 [Nonomuraea longispora]